MVGSPNKGLTAPALRGVWDGSTAQRPLLGRLRWRAGILADTFLESLHNDEMGIRSVGLARGPACAAPILGRNGPETVTTVQKRLKARFPRLQLPEISRKDGQTGPKSTNQTIDRQKNGRVVTDIS